MLGEVKLNLTYETKQTPVSQIIDIYKVAAPAIVDIQKYKPWHGEFPWVFRIFNGGAQRICDLYKPDEDSGFFMTLVNKAEYENRKPMICFPDIKKDIAVFYLDPVDQNEIFEK